MSPIGRAFVVLNLFLAAAFLGWAANALYTTDNFKGQLEAEKAAHDSTRTSLQSEIDTLQSKSRQLEGDLTTRSAAKDTAQAEADSLRTQLEASKREADKLGAEITKITNTLGDFNTQIGQMNGQKDDAVQRASEAETARDDAIEAQQAAELAQRDAEEKAAKLDQEIADMQVSMNDLNGKYESLQTQLQVLIETTGVTPELIAVQPLINGVSVLGVHLDQAPGLVLLNAGKDKDIRRGYTFEVWRGKQYKGQVRVIDVQDNVASCIIVNAVPGATMAQGDTASTRI